MKLSISFKPYKFSDALKSIDDGKFSKLIDSLEVDDECLKCFYLNPSLTDPNDGYRCKCIGTCIAETLSPSMLSYLFWKLGHISEDEHNKNVIDNVFHKTVK